MRLIGSLSRGFGQPYLAHQLCRSSMVAGSPKTSLSMSLPSLLQITFGWFLYVPQAIIPAVTVGSRS